MTNHPPMLTAKEIDVLRLAAKGSSTKNIALKLNVSTKAIDQRIARASTKLKAKNRTHAVAEAIRLRILTV